MAQMSDTRLRAILQSQLSAADSFNDSELASQRQKALDYYYGEPFGNEEEGRSQVVSTDVADTVEWILPSLMRIFCSGDKIVEFEPTDDEDVPRAEQATEYVNWIVDKDNPGFMLFYEWFKDALIQKTGIVKTWWQEEESHETETYENLTEDELQTLLANPDLEPVAFDQVTVETPMGVQVLQDVTVRKTEKKGRVCIEAVPPEEFFISPRAKTIESAGFCAHRVRRTRTELIEMGYDREQVMGIPRIEGQADDKTARYDYDDTYPDEAAVTDPASEEVWYTEAYQRVDYNGDGLSELRQICFGGERPVEILSNEEFDVMPFSSLCPVPMPHKFTGLSVADLVMDLQLLKSTLWRQMLDNLYLSNNPEKEVVQNMVNMDDLLVSRPGGIKRVKQIGSIREIAVPFTAGASFPMLEYIDSVRENRTGVTRYNQGVDANTLNKTATGISQIMTASQQRIELIARIFAETGVKDLFKKILRLVGKYQQSARMVRLRNKFVAMDPSQWNHRMDVTINVGLGHGNKDQLMAHLLELLNIQREALAMQGGAKGPLVDIRNVYSTLEKIVQAMGMKSIEPFFNQPPEGPMPQQPPQPSPEQVKAQADMAQEQMRAQAKLQEKELELTYQREKDAEDRAFERWKVEYENEVKLTIERQKHDAQAEQAAQQAEQQSEELADG